MGNLEIADHFIALMNGCQPIRLQLCLQKYCILIYYYDTPFSQQRNRGVKINTNLCITVIYG